MTLTFRVSESMTEDERRAYRRAVLEHLAAKPATTAARDPEAQTVAEGARLLLEQVEAGDEECGWYGVLFGYPTRLIDFKRAYASLEIAASRFRTSQGTTEPGSRRQGA